MRIVTALSWIVLPAAWSSGVQPSAFSQTTGQRENSVSDSSVSPGPNASSTNRVNAEVLQELERMRARIEELETQLKQSGGAAITGTTESRSQSGTTQNVTSPAPLLPVAGQSSEAATVKPAKAEPFAFADWTWLNGNPRTKQPAFDSKFFTPEIRADVDYVYDFNHPKDDTIGGSSEVFRSDEVHVTQLGVGGDFHYDNVRGRLMTQFGLYSQTTPRNDASPSRGQWNLDNAYRYISEAYGGYHFNALHGINVDAGIFMSYIGLFSYYQFDNWAYQPPPWPRSAIPVAAERLAIGPRESVRLGCRCTEHARAHPLSHGRQHSDQVLRQSRKVLGQSRVLAHRRYGMRARRRRQLRGQFRERSQAELFGVHDLQPPLVR